jgi:hypothetical protein
MGFLDAGTTRCCSRAHVPSSLSASRRVNPGSFPRSASSLHPPISKRAPGHPGELACMNQPLLAVVRWLPTFGPLAGLIVTTSYGRNCESSDNAGALSPRSNDSSDKSFVILDSRFYHCTRSRWIYWRTLRFFSSDSHLLLQDCKQALQCYNLLHACSIFRVPV